MSKYITLENPVGTVSDGESFIKFRTNALPAKLCITVKTETHNLAVYRNITVEEVDGVIKHIFDGQGTVMDNLKQGVTIDITSDTITTVKVLAPMGYLVTVSEITVKEIRD